MNDPMQTTTPNQIASTPLVPAQGKEVPPQPVPPPGSLFVHVVEFPAWAWPPPAAALRLPIPPPVVFSKPTAPVSAPQPNQAPDVARSEVDTVAEIGAHRPQVRAALWQTEREAAAGLGPSGNARAALRSGWY